MSRESHQTQHPAPWSRRAVLRHLGLGATTLLAACAVPRPVSKVPDFTFGPASTVLSSQSALVWLRTEGPGQVTVEYAPQPDWTQAMITAPLEARAENDYTLVCDLPHLQPDTDYWYRGLLHPAGAVATPVQSAVGRLHTAPDAATTCRFAWSGDLEAGHQPFTLCSSILEHEPQFCILLGDTIYADIPRYRMVTTLAGYRDKHRENRSDPHLQALLARVPVVAMWDDHEVANDFDRTHPRIPQGRQAFREYWPLRTHSPDPTVLYRHVPWGPLVDLFVLDCRQYRSPRSAADGPTKTMLGETQKTWLKDRLRASTAPWKFLVSSVPFLGEWGRDKWSGYRTEREELLRFLATERIAGLVILSADMHLAMDMAGPHGLREFIAGPLGARRLCHRPFFPRARLQANGQFFVCDQLTYGLVTVRPHASPSEAEITFLDASNTIRHRVVVQAERPARAT